MYAGECGRSTFYESRRDQRSPSGMHSFFDCLILEGPGPIKDIADDWRISPGVPALWGVRVFWIGYSFFDAWKISIYPHLRRW